MVRGDAEPLSVALILSCANQDTNGSASLLVSMSRDELMAVATYCAQFAVGMSRQLGSVIDSDVDAEIRNYALRLAVAGSQHGPGTSRGPDGEPAGHEDQDDRSARGATG